MYGLIGCSANPNFMKIDTEAELDTHIECLGTKLHFSLTDDNYDEYCQIDLGLSVIAEKQFSRQENIVRKYKEMHEYLVDYHFEFKEILSDDDFVYYTEILEGLEGLIKS